MSDGKHTPGPWSVANDGITASIAGAAKQIVSVTWAGGQQSANARLIAAAPDLSDAAQKARLVLGAMVQLHPTGMALHALNALDAAIAKATTTTTTT